MMIQISTWLYKHYIVSEEVDPADSTGLYSC